MRNVRVFQFAEIWLALLICLVPVVASPADTAQEARWRELNAGAIKAHQQGAYDRGVTLAEEARHVAEAAFGAQDARTLTSLNNLAGLYDSQGRYGEAEPLYEQALQLRRQVLGETHPDTLTSLNNLAGLYDSQGRYGEAEPLYEQALQLSRQVLGETHPDTLGSLNNLAFLYDNQGRYGEAEPLYEQALQLYRQVLGETHPNTLTSLNNLAFLYDSQGRYGEAEPLLKQALQLRQQVLGETHPDTLGSLNNLALLYDSQGRYGEAEPLYVQALQLYRQVLGETHPDTLTSLNNLAKLYSNQGRYGEAEPLYEQALQLYRQVLDETHPNTLGSLNNLAVLYWNQGRYGEAEPLYEQALQLRQQVLGPAHPDTQTTHLNSIRNMVALGQPGRAIGQLRQLEPHLLTRLGVELYSTQSAAVRRALVVSQSSYQDVAFSLAVQHQELGDAQETAASAALRFKGLQAEEEAYLARLSRRGEDPRIQSLAREIRVLRAQLSHTFNNPVSVGKVDVDALVRDLETKELSLGRISRDYARQLQVRSASLTDLQGVLRDGTTLVEFLRYVPADFKAGTRGEAHWAAVVLAGFARPVVLDLGPVSATGPAVTALLAGGPDGEVAARALYDRLIAPLEPVLAGAGTVVLAPDGELHLVPFAGLRLPDSRAWAQVRALRVVQSGRDLLRPPADQPARGLLALGGIDFDTAVQVAAVAEQAKGAEIPDPPIDGGSERLRSLTEESFRQGFAALPGSAEEMDLIARLYRIMRRDEPVETWTADQATEDQLKANARPPRVLHLATHGFYRPGEGRVDQPMLLSGVTLAGANRALRGEGEDGILYAVESQGLNLEGTELVVLSACETARGPVAYGEGVYGLVRALRTAGAANVLVTLRPVGDTAAGEFMDRFYRHWLAQRRSDPAAALQQTQRDYIAGRAKGDWQPFILIGGAEP